MKRKDIKHQIITGFLLSLLLGFFSSCSEPNEKAHPAYQAAVKLFEEHNYPESAKKYEEYLDFNRTSSKTHLKLAKLYGDYLDNPFGEAYHYEKYLFYNPDVSDKADIKAWIKAAKKKFAKKIIQQYPEDFNLGKKDELQNLKIEKRRLIMYMKKLKQEIADYRRKAANSVLEEYKSEKIEKIVSSKKPEIKLNGQPKEYTVSAGDTLSKISKRFYGSSKYYKAIYKANQDRMRSESDLKIGMTLKIPQVKK
jgi:LysM repeat protein